MRELLMQLKSFFYFCCLVYQMSENSSKGHLRPRICFQMFCFIQTAVLNSNIFNVYVEEKQQILPK